MNYLREFPRFNKRELINLCILLALLILGSSTLHADLLVATGTSLKHVDLRTHTTSTLSEEKAKAVFYDKVNSFIYIVTNDNIIKRMTQSGGNLTTIREISGSWGINDLVIDNTNKKIIWTDPVSASIYRSNLDGSNLEPIVNGISSPTGIDIDNNTGKIFWSTEFGEIFKADLDGSNSSLLYLDAMNSGEFENITIHSEYIFWTDVVNKKVFRANLDGSNVTAFISNTKAHGIAYDSIYSRLYFVSSDSSGSGLTARSLNEDSDTSIDEELFGYDIAEGFATSGSSFSFNSRIYISFTDTDKTIPYISWIDHTGYEEVVIDFINLVNPTALTYREKTQRIYWVDQITSSKAKICSALYDGSDIQTHTTINGAINNILINEESGKIFITETTGKKLLSLNLNSPNTTTVVKSLDSPPIAGLFNIEGSDRIIFGEEYVLKTMSTTDNSIDKTIQGWTRGLYAFNIADKKIIQGFYPVAGNFVGNIYKYEESVYNIPYFYTVLKHDRKISRIAYQKLYGDIFDTPHAFYVGVHDPNNQLNAQLYVIIPNKQRVWDPSVIPLRRFSSKTRITGLVDVPIPPAYSIPQPTPFPEDENGKTKISGKLTNFDSEENEIPASGVSVYAEKQDSQDTNELSQGLSDDLGHYSTISDENGLFNIADVTPGKYKLYFQKEDLSFMTNEISFDTSTDTLNTVRASQVDLEGTNCRKKDKTALMLSIESSIASAAKQALETASSKFESSKYQNNLTAQSDSLKDLYAELTEAGRNLPKIELVCKKTTTCEKVTFKNERKTFTKKVKAIKNIASKLLLTALKGQSSKKVKKSSLAKLNKKAKTALKKLKKISKNTYSCNTNEDQENL